MGCAGIGCSVCPPAAVPYMLIVGTVESPCPFTGNEDGGALAGVIEPAMPPI